MFFKENVMGFKKKDTKVSFTMQKYLLDCKFSKKKIYSILIKI